MSLAMKVLEIVGGLVVLGLAAIGVYALLVVWDWIKNPPFG